MPCSCNDKVHRAAQLMSGDTDPATEVPDTTFVAFVQNSLAALRTLREEIRIDLNLAGQEVRDRWRSWLARRSP
jgi:hypothetical protein